MLLAFAQFYGSVLLIVATGIAVNWLYNKFDD